MFKSLIFIALLTGCTPVMEPASLSSQFNYAANLTYEDIDRGNLYLEDQCIQCTE